MIKRDSRPCFQNGHASIFALLSCSHHQLYFFAQSTAKKVVALHWIYQMYSCRHTDILLFLSVSLNTFQISCPFFYCVLICFASFPSISIYFCFFFSSVLSYFVIDTNVSNEAVMKLKLSFTLKLSNPMLINFSEFGAIASIFFWLLNFSAFCITKCPSYFFHVVRNLRDFEIFWTKRKKITNAINTSSTLTCRVTTVANLLIFVRRVSWGVYAPYLWLFCISQLLFGVC